MGNAEFDFKGSFTQQVLCQEGKMGRTFKICQRRGRNDPGNVPSIQGSQTFFD